MYSLIELLEFLERKMRVSGHLFVFFLTELLEFLERKMRVSEHVFVFSY